MDRPHHIVTDIATAPPKLRAINSSGAKVTLSDGKEYIDLMNGKVRNNLQAGVLEPMHSKIKAFKYILRDEHRDLTFLKNK